MITKKNIDILGVQHQLTSVWPTTLGKPAVKLIGALHRQIPLILMPLPTAARQLLRENTAYQ